MSVFFRAFRRATRQHPWMMAAAACTSVCMSMVWVAEPLYARWAIDTLLTLRDGADVPVGRIFAGWGAIFLTMNVA